MEGSSNPESVPSSSGRTPIMSGPLLSDPLEKLHNQTDSVLTAARLARRGWTEDGNKTGWQFTYFDLSHQPSVSRSDDGNQAPKQAETCLKEPRSRQVHIGNNTAEDRQGTSSDKKVKQTEAAANRQAETQTCLYSQTSIRVRVSGCRTTCRQSRRFKAPILPVIAEM